MFRLLDDTADPMLLVDAIHDEEGYRSIRRSLAQSYDPGLNDADIQVVDVDLSGDRQLMLEHRTHPGQLLAKKDAEATLRQLGDTVGLRRQAAGSGSGNRRGPGNPRGEARGLGAAALIPLPHPML